MPSVFFFFFSKLNTVEITVLQHSFLSIDVSTVLIAQVVVIHCLHLQRLWPYNLSRLSTQRQHKLRKFVACYVASVGGPL